MKTASECLKKEHIIHYGSKHGVDVPKVIDTSLSIAEFKHYKANGLIGRIQLCLSCANTLKYAVTFKNRTETYYNGSFRANYCEDYYMDGSYYRTYPIGTQCIDFCYACKVEDTNGCEYRIEIQEISTWGISTKEFERGQRVELLGTNLIGTIEGSWKDMRVQHRQWKVNFDNGGYGWFLNWQLAKLKG